MTQSPSIKPVVPRRVSGIRIGSFVIIFLSVLLTTTWFVSATWNHFWQPAGKLAWQIIPTLLGVIFIVTTIVSRRYSNLLISAAYRISALWLGVLNYFFFAACAAWIFSGAAAALSFHIENRLIAAVFFGSGILTSLYGFLNASWLRVTKVTVKLANLPEPWSGRHVALATDLHLGNIWGAGLARRMVDKLKDLPPAVVFISGDLFDGSEADYEALIEPFKDLAVSGGIYFVTGNHEEFTDRAKYIDAVKRAGIRVLNNEKVEINGLQIIGVHDGELHNPKLYRLLLEGTAVDRNRPSILLAHQPLNLAIPEEEGISLQVSGHTHGGQFWPWTKVAARVHGRFNRGLNRLDNLQVLTSNGVGTWGAPMRVGTRSEIILIQLEPDDSMAPNASPR
jgi:predicted MPP superfamily phosphohydrolase